MAKRSKKKKRFNYNETEFIKNACSQCRICNKNNPTFCYNEVYKSNNKLFFKVVLPRLIKARKKWVENIDECDDDDIVNIFKYSFCKSNYCNENYNGRECEFLAGCIQAFRSQLYSKDYGTITKYVKSQKRKKYKNKKCKNTKTYKSKEIKASFFCREGFLTEVKKIIYGNSCKQ